MDLIYDRGLNCRLACIISIAHSLGVNYPDAFAALWSEMDFTDEAKHSIYVSKRVFTRLNAIGVMIESLDFDTLRTQESMPQIAVGNMLVVGMDTYDIPWHPVCRHFRGTHYFFAQKETPSAFLCFDPVYGQKNQILHSRDLLSAAFELSHVYAVKASPPKHGPLEEAEAVLRSHPKASPKWLAEILACKGDGRRIFSVLIKQITAMINNRYLFRRFWNSSAACEIHTDFFSEAFLLQWEAVRNGLYKASIVRDNAGVIDEVHCLLAGLMQKEMAMATEIVSAGR